MVSANGAIVDMNIYRDHKESNAVPQAQRATAFHFLTSNLF